MIVLSVRRANAITCPTLFLIAVISLSILKWFNCCQSDQVVWLFGVAWTRLYTILKSLRTNNGWNEGGWGQHFLGGPIEGDAAVGQNGDGRLEMFARGTDNNVYHRWQEGNGWNPSWGPLGTGQIMGNVAVARNDGGTLEAFVRGTENGVYHRWQKVPGGARNDGNWRPLPGLQATSDVAVARRNCLPAAQGGWLGRCADRTCRLQRGDRLATATRLDPGRSLAPPPRASPERTTQDSTARHGRRRCRRLARQDPRGRGPHRAFAARPGSPRQQASPDHRPAQHPARRLPDRRKPPRRHQLVPLLDAIPHRGPPARAPLTVPARARPAGSSSEPLPGSTNSNDYGSATGHAPIFTSDSSNWLGASSA